MAPVDVLAKLSALTDHLDDFNDDDKQFITQILSCQETGKTLSICDITRIVGMQIPGEDPPIDAIWKEGTVSAIRKDLDKVIWRYLPIEGLFFLLSTKTLHFSPLSAMEDTNEGQLPLRAYEQTKAQLPQHILRGTSGIDPDTITAIMVEQRRRDACVSCWYMADTDDFAMWTKYGPKNGVAIRTTVGRLCSCLRGCNHMNIHLDRVTYYGHDEAESYIDQAFYGSLFIKHDPFRTENELRALAYSVNSGAGVDVPVNLDLLVERLVLSPELSDWAVPSLVKAIRNFVRGGEERSHNRQLGAEPVSPV